MKTLKPVLLAAALLSTSFCAFAAETEQTNNEEPKFTIKPTGRILLDGAAYSPDGDGLDAGVAVPDARVGVKMGYGNWSAKIDVGYANGKVGLKDIYIQYTFNPENLIRGGYFVQQFGLQSATSSSMKPTMEAPITDSYMSATSRNLGIMWIHNEKPFFAGVTALIAGKSMTINAGDQGKTSFGGVARLVYRPYTEGDFKAQIGMSGWWQTPLHNTTTDADGHKVTSPGYFDWSVNFPTRVCSVKLLSANINDAKNVVKLSPEVLLSKGRVALEGQYYYMSNGRKGGLPTYSAQGAYGLIRGIAIGKSYGYSYSDAGLATPAPKSLEFVAAYNYTNANCNKAQIYAGISNDYSITANYYINKYMLARLRYSYTNVRGSSTVENRHANIIQARLQVIF